MQIEFNCDLFSDDINRLKLATRDPVLSRPLRESAGYVFETIVSRALNACQCARGTKVVDIETVDYVASVKSIRRDSQNAFWVKCLQDDKKEISLADRVDRYYDLLESKMRPYFELQLVYDENTLATRVYVASLLREDCEFKNAQGRLMRRCCSTELLATDARKGIVTFEVSDVENKLMRLF